MKKLFASLLLTLVSGWSVAEQTKTVFSPFTGKLDFITAVSTNNFQGSGVTCTGGVCTFTSSGGGASGQINAAPQYNIPYYSVAGSSNVLDGASGFKIDNSSITITIPVTSSSQTTLSSATVGALGGDYSAVTEPRTGSAAPGSGILWRFFPSGSGVGSPYITKVWTNSGTGVNLRGENWFEGSSNNRAFRIDTTLATGGIFAYRPVTLSSGTTFSGGITISTTVKLGTDPGTNGQVMTSGGDGAVPTWTTVSASGGGYAVEPATVTFNLALGVNATTATISSTVGIGTTTPQYNLHVYSATDYAYAAVQSASTTAGAFSLWLNDDGKDALFGHYGSATAGTYFGGVANAGAALFAAEGSSSLGIGTSANSPVVFGTTNLERMRINGNGAVTINSSVTVTGAGGLAVTYGTTVGTITVNSGVAFTQSYKAAVCQSGTASLGFSAFTSSMPAVSCAVSSSTVMGYAAFVDVSTASVQDHFTLPTDWTGAVNAYVLWHSTATSGDVVWQIRTGCADDGEIGAVTWNAFSTVTDTTKGTASQFNEASITGITTTGCAAGEEFFFEFLRNPVDASDTLASIANLVTLQLVIRRTLAL